MAERTQEAYLRAVRQLSQDYSGTLPADLTEQQVKDDLPWMRSETRAAPGTFRIATGGLRFFYRQILPVTRKVLDRFRIPKAKKLPNVLTVLEVRRIFHALRQPRFYAWFAMTRRFGCSVVRTLIRNGSAGPKSLDAARSAEFEPGVRFYPGETQPESLGRGSLNTGV